MNFTKGEWTSHLDGTVRNDDCSKTIATINTGNSFFSDEDRANLNLLSHAPKMYKLLEQYKTITGMHNNEAQEKLIDLQYAVDELFEELSD